MSEEIKQEEIIEEELVEEVAVPEESEEEVESLPKTVEVGGKEYILFKEGIEQAQQVSDLLNWLGKYGDKLADAFVVKEGEVGADNLWGMLSAIGKAASTEALLDLFVVVIGCTRKDAEKYFSITSLIDGIEVLFSQEEYNKVLNRFF